ncbi:MAG: enoyl-CoA hydratase/isomerase family protein [Alphaproteobacteria bacterium]|nr:enoyl-CoA hydratase/isomerase family protein [Alphaproteobacteria bacterium]MCB9928297.1 enoyl-CoA hydratase/isomerase family protein [Alphaproteobacteria bacterium]
MTALPPCEHFLLERDADWLTIWFNRPEARNALSKEVSAELAAVVAAVREDRSLRGVTLRGKGRVFCAGGDIKGFQSVFQGAAIAGGLGLTCCADVVVVTEDALFSMTETQIGIVPAQIAPFVIGRIGLPAARRLMLTGGRFRGAEALRLGLADYVVASEAALGATELEIRTGVRSCSPAANAETKALIMSLPRLTPEEARQAGGYAFGRCMLSAEGREGVASFIEKRKPRWAE